MARYLFFIFVAAIVGLPIFSIATGEANEGTSQFRTKKICPNQMEVCFTLPLIWSKSYTEYRSRSSLVVNMFRERKGRFVDCSACDPAEAIGYTVYRVQAHRQRTKAVLERLIDEEDHSDTPCTGLGSNHHKKKIGPVKATVVSCRGFNAEEFGVESYLRREVIWRYSGLTYQVTLERRGKHPPARWDRFLKSFRFRR